MKIVKGTENPVEFGNLTIAGEPLLRWTGNPWKTRRWKLIQLLVMFMILTAFLVWAVPELGVFILIFPLLLIGSSINHLVPNEYLFTTEGIYHRNIAFETYKPWKEVRTYVIDDEFGEVFFHAKGLRQRLNRYMPIYYNENRVAIEELVKRFVPKSRESSEG